MTRDIREGDLVDHLDAYGGVFRDRCLPGDVAGRLCSNRGCHLVARAERLAEVWPTDDAFRRFAAEVADAVQAAIGRGDTVTSVEVDGAMSDDRLMCPMGAVFVLKGDPHPNWAEARRRFPVSCLSPDRASFVSGFDDRQDVARDPYYRLGQAYRRRFVAGDVTGAGDQS